VSPIGADTREMQPLDPTVAPDCDVLFLANFRHGPNVDAARWLADEILPAASRPIRARIVGARWRPSWPTTCVRAASTSAVRSTIRGRATGRRRCSSRRCGSGTACAARSSRRSRSAGPLVTTTIGAEGLGAIDGTHLLLADDADAYAAAIERLLDDPTLAGRVGAAAAHSSRSASTTTASPTTTRASTRRWSRTRARRRGCRPIAPPRSRRWRAACPCR
jgi:hypothetical protein